ncbi:MAG: polysaccharide deacetylase family protein, partial [Phycisphaerae bacterium]
MKRLNALLVVAVLITVVSVGYCGTVDPPYEVGTWQGFSTAAVSYTFDDNLPNQLAIAVPMFDEFGFKLTLYTVTGSGWYAPANWTGLQAAAANGHEIGSHTVTHPSLNTKTIEVQTTELVDSQN